MTAEVVNLRRVRKAKQRVARADEAAANRVRHGQSRVAREARTLLLTRADRILDNHRLPGGDDTDA